MSAPSSLRARLFAGTLLALTLAPAAARAEDTARDADGAALRWREGDPVPEGYRRRQPGVGAGVAAAGATVFGVSYVAMGARGALGLLSWLAYRGDPSPILPAFVPLAGPFVLASTIDSNPSFRAFLVVDGSLQIAGLAMAAVGAYVHVSSRAVLVRGYTKFFKHKFDASHGMMVRAGGTPYTGPLPIYHEIWHAVFCGLGDFDTKYGYKWDDRVAYKHAYPILAGKYGLTLPPWEPDWYTFNATYDGTGKYPIFFSEAEHYHDIIREKVVGDITRDPLWYLDILWKRTVRVLEKTPPVSVHIGKQPLHTTSAVIGYASVALGVFLALSRRWTLLKILVFTLPLSAPALIIYSDRGMTNYSTFHFFGVAMSPFCAACWLPARAPG